MLKRKKTPLKGEKNTPEGRRDHSQEKGKREPLQGRGERRPPPRGKKETTPREWWKRDHPQGGWGKETLPNPSSPSLPTRGEKKDPLTPPLLLTRGKRKTPQPSLLPPLRGKERLLPPPVSETFRADMPNAGSQTESGLKILIAFVDLRECQQPHRTF